MGTTRALEKGIFGLLPSLFNICTTTTTACTTLRMEERTLTAMALGGMALGLGISVSDYLCEASQGPNFVEKINRASPDPELQVGGHFPVIVLRLTLRKSSTLE
jgi:hypothetical protein